MSYVLERNINMTIPFNYTAFYLPDLGRLGKAICYRLLTIHSYCIEFFEYKTSQLKMIMK